MLGPYLQHDHLSPVARVQYEPDESERHQGDGDHPIELQPGSNEQRSQYTHQRGWREDEARLLQQHRLRTFSIDCSGS